MYIPDFQSIMLPLLEIASDKKNHEFRDVIEILTKRFKLTDEQKQELLPSGKQPIFENRTGWAKTHLKKAGLLNYPKRGCIEITERGISVLEEKPEKIDMKFLKRFDEYNEFLNLTNQNKTEDETIHDIENHTPEELIETAFQNIKRTLADEILEKIRNVTPTFFERLVVDLLVKMGYGGSIKDAGKAIGKTNDEGIDGTIKEDKLGLDIIYIQAKRWKEGNVVGRPEIQKFVGALAGQGAKKGIFITASSFSKEALEYAPKNETKIIMIDGIQLAELMIEYNVGVSNQQIYEIKKMDSDYFGEN
ncbi:restriction endonuclease [Treponema primitia]|uniref:restriction endonuclease n=1 Tax=Treponema primitia TaxID=88058 RepID=UPI00397F1CFB